MMILALFLVAQVALPTAFVSPASAATVPTITSATATNLVSVKVVFSEAMDTATTATASNYALNLGATVTGVTAVTSTGATLSVSTMEAGTTYALTVSGVQDAELPPVPIATNSTMTFMSPQGPTIVSAEVASPVTVTVVFSEAINAATATEVANYVIDSNFLNSYAAATDGAAHSLSGDVTVIEAALAADQRTVTLTTSPMAAGTWYGLVVNNIQDTTVPPITIAPDSTVVLRTPPAWTGPVIQSVAATSPVSVTVVFWWAIDSATATDVANYALSGEVSKFQYAAISTEADPFAPSGSVTVIRAVLADDQRTVTLTTRPMASDTLYTLQVSDIQDTSVPPITIAPNSTVWFTTPTWPVVTSVTATNLVSVAVGFSKAMDAATATHVANYAVTFYPEPPFQSGGAMASADDAYDALSDEVAVIGATLSADQRTVTLTTSPMYAGERYALTVSNVQDTTVPPLVVAPDSGGLFYTPAPPRIMSATATNLVNITVVFSKAMDAATVTDAANYSLPAGVTVTGAVAVDATTVVLTTSPMAAAAFYRLKVNNVQDTTVPPIAARPDSSGWFTTPALPTIMSARTSNLVNVWVSFSRAMDIATITDIANYAISGGVTVTGASSASSTTVVLSTSPMEASTAYSVTINNLQDATAPSIAMTPNSTWGFTTPTRPIIYWAEAQTLKEVRVRFSKMLDTATATDAANYALSGGVSVISAAMDDPNYDGVILTTSMMEPGTVYTLTVNNVHDSSRPPIAILPNSTKTFASVARPTILYARNQNLVNVTVYFSQYMDMTTVTNAANYTMSSGVTVTGVISDGGSATLTTTPMEASTTYTVTVNNVRDTLVPPIDMVPNATTSFTTPARPTITAVVAPTLVNVWITLSCNIGAATEADGVNYALSGGVTVIGASWKDMRSVALTTSPMAPGTTYTLTVNNLGDTTVPPITVAPNTTKTFTTPVGPAISSATTTSMAKVKVVFSKMVSMATATNASNYAVSGGVAVTGVTRVNAGSVELSTSPMAPGTAYTVTALNIADTLAPPIVAPSSTQTFMTPGPFAVTIIAPLTGRVCGCGSEVVLTATASDVRGTVTGLEFFDGAAKLGDAGFDVAKISWTFDWSTAGATFGPHSITARATDGSGLAAVSDPATVVQIRIPADGNGDGTVDDLDYNAWQNGYQEPGATFATGDFNGDGGVDGLDYNVWQNSYNHTAVYVGDGLGQLAAAKAPAGATTPAAGNAPHLVGMTPEPGAAVGDVMRLTLVFDCAVEVGAGAVEVYGAAGGQHRDFVQAYDAATETLTLTWAKALSPDAYTVRVIADFVTAAGGGAPVDGETGDPTEPNLPSGDGAPGGDARLVFTAE